MNRNARMELGDVQCPCGTTGRRRIEITPIDGTSRCTRAPDSAIVSHPKLASVACNCEGMGIYVGDRPARKCDVSPGCRCGSVCGADDRVPPAATGIHDCRI